MHAKITIGPVASVEITCDAQDAIHWLANAWGMEHFYRYRDPDRTVVFITSTGSIPDLERAIEKMGSRLVITF